MIFNLLSFLFFLGLAWVAGKHHLHMMQLAGYKQKPYLNWFSQQLWKEHKGFILFLLVPILQVSLALPNWINPLGLLLLFTLIYQERKKHIAKKPLQFTARAKRLYVTFLVLMCLLGLALLLWLDAAFYYSLLTLIPLWMLIANLLMKPVEQRVHAFYYKQAQSKIATHPQLKVVGITGSYGKTSTKFAVATILNERFNVLKTPESYNTPMGISKVINTELGEEHEVFVAEMGARHVGDIKELADLVRPQFGILTSIAPVHIETMKNIETVAQTKYELINSLPQDGIAIFNGDNPYCRDLVAKSHVTRTYTYGTTEAFSLSVKEIQPSPTGTAFTVIDQEGEAHPMQTRLLGEHNVLNLLAGILLGQQLGMTWEEITQGVAKVEPVPHRLQLITSPNGVTVIDDAFNSNPDGARAALQVLSAFPGKKVIVTPGMIELGHLEYEENKKLGQEIAKVCDIAILVGKKRSQPIQEGLQAANFPQEQLFVVSNLQEATTIIGQTVRPGDVVLFENDLPDNYEE